MIQVGGEHFLFEDGQVWRLTSDGLWQRTLMTLADLDSGTFERATG